MASRRTQQLDMLLIITMLILFGIMKLRHVSVASAQEQLLIKERRHRIQRQNERQ
jgi:hypothetical protein